MGRRKPVLLLAIGSLFPVSQRWHRDLVPFAKSLQGQMRHWKRRGGSPAVASQDRLADGEKVVDGLVLGIAVVHVRL
jgi:hypothetical protein